MNILVADDDALIRRLLLALLTKLGHTVQVAEDGHAAWKALDVDNPPSLAILDWVMPGMDGVDTCRAVRANCSARIPIVVVTGVADPSWRAAAYEAGADKILDKDVSIEMLRSNLISAIDSLGT